MCFLSWLGIWILGTIPIVLTCLFKLPHWFFLFIKQNSAILINRYLLFITNTRAGRKIHYYGDDINLSKNRNIILVMNHTSSVDLIAATLILEKLNCSKFVRYLSKTFNLLLPIAGYGFMLMGFAPLSRNNTEQDINRIKKSVIKSINSDEKILYILFPEGTRFNLQNDEVIKKKDKFLMDKFGKSTIYVLAPRISGFYTLIQSMNKHLDEVLDITVCYSGKDSVHGDFSATSLFDFLWNENLEIHVHVKRWNMSQLQNLNSDCSYLYDWFFTKDKIIGDFISINNNKFENYRETVVNYATESLFCGAILPLVYTILLYLIGYKVLFGSLLILSIAAYVLQAAEIVFETSLL